MPDRPTAHAIQAINDLRARGMKTRAAAEVVTAIHHTTGDSAYLTRFAELVANTPVSGDEARAWLVRYGFDIREQCAGDDCTRPTGSGKRVIQLDGKLYCGHRCATVWAERRLQIQELIAEALRGSND